jgi:hypothetical protein
VAGWPTLRSLALFFLCPDIERHPMYSAIRF